MSNVLRPTFVCFRASAEAHLDSDEKAVLRVLKDARGFYKSSGLSIPDLMKRLNWKTAESALEIQALLLSLERLGLAKKLSSGNWKRS